MPTPGWRHATLRSTRSAGQVQAETHSSASSRRQSGRPPRQAAKTHNYHESSSSSGEGEEGEYESSSGSEPGASPQIPARRSARNARSTTRPNPGGQTVITPPRRRQAVTVTQSRHPMVIRSKASIKSSLTASSKKTKPRRSPGKVSPKRSSRRAASSPPRGNIPNWLDPRIPYEFWVKTFLHASSDITTDYHGNGWLLRAALTCKAFAEPALTALYYSPTIRHPSRARRLAALLEKSPSETRFNYRSKIELLHIDIQTFPMSTLFPMVHYLTRLKDLILYTPLDQPPYRKLDLNVRWHYPEDVFRALLPTSPNPSGVVEKQYATYLRSWEWSGRLIGDYVQDIPDMARIHQLPTFSNLTRLGFTNFQVPSLQDPQLQNASVEKELEIYQKDHEMIASIGDAISHLKHLKHLIFESSTVMCDKLLEALPHHLLHLELVNCWEVKSEDLAEFLLTKGRDLRTLTLLHNQSLDLGFLPILGQSCPNLRELDVNMSYFKLHDSVNDADPMYDSALLEHQVPTWPSSLRVLSIDHIRNWTKDTAEMFFQTLVNSSQDLPDLRFLGVKTILDIPWSARAAFRNYWCEQITRVFLRPYLPPQSPPGALDSKPRPSNDDGNVPTNKRKRSSSPSRPTRRSGRIAAYNESDSNSGSARKSRRTQSGRSRYQDPDTDEDETENSGSEDPGLYQTLADGTDRKIPTIQGLCTTVNITIDNQKVRELQYGMEDFMEDEDDSEEEWNGDNSEDDGVVIF